MFKYINNGLSLLQSLSRIYQLSRPVKDFNKGKQTLPCIIQVQTISTCNGRCPFCPYPFTSKVLPQGKMEWNTYQKIVDECISFSSLRLFTPMLQNEPLLDKDICKAISYFKDRNGGRVPVFVVTNGYFLRPSLIKQLIGSRLDHLIISLNAHQRETYEELMPGFKYEKILANIENLLSSDLSYTKVTLRFLENQKNKDEIREALTYWRRRGVRTEVLSFISNRADTVDVNRLKAKKSEMIWSSKVKKKALTHFSHCCMLPFYQMNILFNGDVLLCCNDWRRNPIIGNVNRKSLKDIWNDSLAREIKTKVLQRQYESITACKGCSVTEYFESWV